MLLKKIFSFDVIEVWFMAFFAISITATGMGCGRSTSSKLLGGIGSLNGDLSSVSPNSVSYIGRATTAPNTNGALLIGFTSRTAELNERFVILLCRDENQCSKSENFIELQCGGQGIDYQCAVDQLINGVPSQYVIDGTLDASSEGVQIGFNEKYFFVNVYGLTSNQISANTNLGFLRFDVYKIK